MCEPATLTMAGIALAGGIAKGVAAKSAADSNANILRANAAIADNAAGDATDRGNIASGRAQIRGSMLEGHQAAQYASSGVDSQSGTAADVQGGTGGMTALEAAILKNNAQREALGYEKQAENFRRQADDQDAAGTWGMITGGLSGVSSAAQVMRAK